MLDLSTLLYIYLRSYSFQKASMPTDLTMSADYLNIMVYDYLTQIDLKLAAKFKKEVNVMGELPPGSPTVNEIVQFFKETSPEKFNPPPLAEEASKKKKKKCKEEVGLPSTICILSLQSYRG